MNFPPDSPGIGIARKLWFPALVALSLSWLVPFADGESRDIFILVDVSDSVVSTRNPRAAQKVIDGMISDAKALVRDLVQGRFDASRHPNWRCDPALLLEPLQSIVERRTDAQARARAETVRIAEDHGDRCYVLMITDAIRIPQGKLEPTDADMVRRWDSEKFAKAKTRIGLFEYRGKGAEKRHFQIDIWKVDLSLPEPLTRVVGRMEPLGSPAPLPSRLETEDPEIKIIGLRNGSKIKGEDLMLRWRVEPPEVAISRYRVTITGPLSLKPLATARSFIIQRITRSGEYRITIAAQEPAEIASRVRPAKLSVTIWRPASFPIILLITALVLATFLCICFYPGRAIRRVVLKKLDPDATDDEINRRDMLIDFAWQMTKEERNRRELREPPAGPENTPVNASENGEDSPRKKRPEKQDKTVESNAKPGGATEPKKGR